MNEVEEIKSRLDIAEVIGQYVQLQKAGRTLKAPCPFHAEKTPSFIVSPERQSWHCFGACSTGGDVISFVMKREGIEFPEALRMLAEKAGVQLRERRSTPEQDKARERMYAANEEAADWYQKLLAEDAGSHAREYLQKRGLDSETIEAFRLGFSPDEWHAAQEHLTKLGFTERELLGAGLLVEGERGAHDRFRGRLTFPIWDIKGRVVGFGARAMDDSQPKYLNTAQTPLFDKGGTLYALDRAQEAIREEKRAVVVEGYMDVIAAHQYGFRNVIAQMGTALTDRQVRILKRYTADVVLALDSDQAGTQAMIRGHDVVREAGGGGEQPVPVVNWRGLVTYQEAASVELRVAVLPEGKDPDDVIRTDAESWRALIGGARPVLDYRLDAAAEAVDLENPRGRSELVRDFLPLLGAVTDPVVRAHYLQRLSRLSQTGEEELATALRRPQRAETPLRAPQPAAKGNAREEFMLSLLLQHESLRGDGLNVPETLFWDAQARQILVLWKELAEVNAVKDALPPELEAYLERLILRRLPISDAKEAREAFADCLQRLQKERLRAEKQATASEIADLQEKVGVTGLLGTAEQRVIERDTEIGKEIHRHGRSDDGAETVETSVNGN
ncbi:MAG TPA: DNA primase [Dehalococcoidia bacterium]